MTWHSFQTPYSVGVEDFFEVRFQLIMLWREGFPLNLLQNSFEVGNSTLRITIKNVPLWSKVSRISDLDRPCGKLELASCYCTTGAVRLSVWMMISRCFTKLVSEPSKTGITAVVPLLSLWCVQPVKNGFKKEKSPAPSIVFPLFFIIILFSSNGGREKKIRFCSTCEVRWIGVAKELCPFSRGLWPENWGTSVVKVMIYELTRK